MSEVMLAFLTAGVAGLAVLAPQDPLPVEITPQSGDPVVGTWKAPRLTITTEFGSASVKPDKLEQILFGTPDVVVAAGVELRGKLKLSRVDAKVDGRSRRFSPKKLASIVVVRDGAASSGSSFGGEWMTSFGPMTLKQRGKKVEGTYGWGDTGSIEGELDGGELAFEYRSGNGSGEGRFELMKEDGAFKGTYDGERFWGGYRKRPAAASAEPGKITSGQTGCGMRYHIRMPRAHADGKEWPAICILHGSNMDSRSYVNTIASAWPELAEEYVIVGLDGERISSASRPGELRFNYTYINFGGPNVGPTWARRQSPKLVSESLTELEKAHPIRKWFLGGHSQGGFLTYCLVMFFPEQLAGAFPMSCNLLVQCEPDNFEPGRRDAQHEVGLAVVHGRSDNVVSWSGGAYCHLRMVDAGFPFLRLFAPERIGHQFALLPVDEAVRWLAAVSAEDPADLVAYAEERAKAEAWRDVGALLLRLDRREPPAALAGRIKKLEQRLEAAASAPAAKIEQAIARDKKGTGAWIEDFLAFRREFATAPAASAALAAYAKLREEQKKTGDRLFSKSRQAGNKSDRLAIYEEIAETCYATKWYECVKLWSK